MRELYWITVIGNIKTTFSFLTIILSVLFVISAVCYIMVFIENEGQLYWHEGEEESAMKKQSRLKKSLIISTIITTISIILATVLPSKKDLYVIYGVGGTIDYVKNSNEGKKLPENTIKALNSLLEEYSKDNKNKLN